MHNYTIHPDASVGEVALRVSDLRRSVEFYTDVIGFQLDSVTESAASLGAGNGRLIGLHEQPGARGGARTAGLYHFAILVPSRLELARSLRRLIQTRTPLEGFADHLVSEAIYLADPDGNGIELYRDRPRSQWPRRDGQLLMATDPLDVNGLLEELANPNVGMPTAGNATMGNPSASRSTDEWPGLGPGTRIGHVHLQVSDLGDSVSFYGELLGFDLIMRYGPSAAFLSAGGYHHHIGINTWAGEGIPTAPPDDLGLIWFAIDLPNQDAYDQTVQRLLQSSIPAIEHNEGLLLNDPSGIGVLLRKKSA